MSLLKIVLSIFCTFCNFSLRCVSAVAQSCAQQKLRGKRLSVSFSRSRCFCGRHFLHASSCSTNKMFGNSGKQVVYAVGNERQALSIRSLCVLSASRIPDDAITAKQPLAFPGVRGRWLSRTVIVEVTDKHGTSWSETCARSTECTGLG